MGRIFVYRDNRGGTNLRSNEAHINQSQMNTEMNLIQNMEIYREGGVASQKGNKQLNTSVTDETEILGIGEFINSSGDYYAVYVKASGKAYSMAAGGGGETEIKTGLDTSAVPVFTTFNGKIICANGTDAVWKYDGTTATDLGDQPAAWTTDPVVGVASHLGTRLFAISGSTVYFCALGDEDDWSTASDAGSITDAYGDTTDYNNIVSYGDRLILHKNSRKVYTITGSTFSTYALDRLASNRAAKGKQAAANVFDNHYFYTGTEIIGLTTTEFNIVKLGRETELTRKIRPFFTGTEVEMPINSVISTRHNEAVLLPYDKKNELVGYFKTPGNDDGYDTAAIYNFDQGSWVFRVATKVTAAALVNGNILTGTSDGKILEEFFGGNLHNGAAFQKKVLTPYFDFEAPFNRKRITRVFIEFKSSSSLNVTMKVRADHDSSVVLTRTITNSLQDTTSVYGTGTYNNETYAASAFILSDFPLNLAARSFQFEFTSNVSTNDFRIVQYGFEVEYDDPY